LISWTAAWCRSEQGRSGIRKRSRYRRNQSWTLTTVSTDSKSIAERYDDPLDRFEDRHGEILYQPIDTDHVIRLLVELWGDLLTPEAINEAFDRLMGPDTQNKWPHGYCEADETERPLSSYDHPDACRQFVDAYERAKHGKRLLGC